MAATACLPPRVEGVIPLAGCPELTQKRYPSSIEVARLAGVSQSAVSRAFTPGASVSQKTRAKVMAAADTLGFRPSLIPQIMLTNRSGIVAVVVGGLDNPFYGRVLETFATRLRETGKQILLVPVESDYALDAVVAKLSQYRVDAIVSALSVLSPQVASTLSAFRIPVVSFNTPVTAEWVGSVGSDNVEGGRQAAAHLHERGATRFAFLGGPAESPAQQERLKGFHDEVVRRGLPEPVLAGDRYTYASGGAAVAALIEAGNRFDAVFATNDLNAFGAIDTLRRLGWRVPVDVQVVGYDDTAAAGWDAYRLTSLDQDVPALVDAALDLVARISETGECLERVLVPPKLVMRNSTR